MHMCWHPGVGRRLQAIFSVSDLASRKSITVTHSRGFSPHSAAGLPAGLLIYSVGTGKNKKAPISATEIDATVFLHATTHAYPAVRITRKWRKSSDSRYGSECFLRPYPTFPGALPQVADFRPSAGCPTLRYGLTLTAPARGAFHPVPSHIAA